MAETKKKETREQIIIDTLEALWVNTWGNLPHRVIAYNHRLILITAHKKFGWKLGCRF
jgi:hypothetical protein